MDLAVGVPYDDDGGSVAGAVYILTLETYGYIKGAQKLSMHYVNWNAFYTLNANGHFGYSVAALGDVDGNGVVYLAEGARGNADVGSDAGAVYMIFLETNGKIKGAQQLSNLYGNLNAFYMLDASDNFGQSVAALGDVDGGGVVDLAVGAIRDADGGSSAGAVYLINFAQSHFETSDPTNTPVPDPTAVPAPALNGAADCRRCIESVPYRASCA